MKHKPMTVNEAIAQLTHIKHLIGDGCSPLFLVGHEEGFCSFMPISRIEPIEMPSEDEKTEEPVAALFGFEDEEAFDLPPNIPPTPRLKVVKP
jgi:hypothetical protein